MPVHLPPPYRLTIGYQANKHDVSSKRDDRVGVMQTMQSWVNWEYSRGLRTHPWGAPVLRVSVKEVLLPILTACGLPFRKSLEGTIVLNAEL